MTKIINLLGGPGCGKSTIASGIFYELKKNGVNCEIIGEYAKSWAWQGKKILPIDQGYILQKQARMERALFGKVDYIITDSPIILSPIYEMFYNNTDNSKRAVFNFIKDAQMNGVNYLNFVLSRTTPYNSKGRFESFKQAKQLDVDIQSFMDYNNIDYIKVEHLDMDSKVSSILKHIGELL